MIAAGGGHFAVVTSVMGLFSAPLRSGYAGAKHAMHGWFEALRAEHHDDGIRISSTLEFILNRSVAFDRFLECYEMFFGHSIS